MTLKERLAQLEAIAKRTDEQEAELTKVRAEYEKELQDRKKADEDKKLELERVKAENAELKRQAEIKDLASKYDVDEELRDKFVADKEKSADEFVRAILDKKAEKTPALDVKVGDTPNREAMLTEIGDFVAARMGVDVDLAENTFRGATLVDVAKSIIGASGFQMSREEILERAMVTTDFPALLVESGNRRLEQEFDAQALTYQMWVKEVDVPDFRVNSDIIRGSAGGRLDKVTENGELVQKELSENKETWAIETFGNSFTVTREMMINDDLGAFSDLLQEFAMLAGNTANGRTYDMLRHTGDYSAYTMADGYAIFDATHHSNLGTTAFSADALSNARTAMRKQLALDGKTPLNITPSYLIVAPELEQSALQLLNSAASTADNKNSTVYNPHYKSLTLIVDAELATANEWYLATNRRTIKAGYLAGTGRRPVLKTNTVSIARTIFDGVFDFGLMAEDYRGLYKGK